MTSGQLTAAEVRRRLKMKTLCEPEGESGADDPLCNLLLIRKTHDYPCFLITHGNRNMWFMHRGSIHHMLRFAHSIVRFRCKVYITQFT